MKIKLISVGYDPGIANFGWAVLYAWRQNEDPGAWHAKIINYGCVITKPPDRKQRALIRITSDDQRRLDLIICELREVNKFADANAKAMRAEKIVLGLEWPHMAGRRGSTALTLGAAYVLARSLSSLVIPWSGQDVKEQTCGKKKASKEEIQETIEGIFKISFANKVNDVTGNVYPKEKREHMADAIAMARMNLREYDRITCRQPI